MWGKTRKEGRQRKRQMKKNQTSNDNKKTPSHNLLHESLSLEAQQRCYSYCPILVAIVSQNSLVLVQRQYRIIARYRATNSLRPFGPDVAPGRVPRECTECRQGTSCPGSRERPAAESQRALRDRLMSRGKN